MSHPDPTPTSTNVPPPAPSPEELAEAVVTARKIDRIKTFTKSTFKNVGVPVLIGGVAALVVSRRQDSESSDEAESNDNDTDTTE